MLRHRRLPELIPDTDNDGVLDAFDACINDPEDLDGVEDTDGCPEAPVQPTPTPGATAGDGRDARLR